ncbi:MAG: RidA family protein [Proteobacteria bacterium]|jgi:enamine deaminase RidA (YjgF/YER057c/UK114 family)|nr:RidA family protein [Pseudomonadota bacterium]
MSIEQRLIDLGLELPQPMNTDTLPFDLIRADGNRLYLSGHVPTDLTGKVSQPFGKVGADVSEDEAYRIAARIALGLCASIKAHIGDLDRVDKWLRIFGMVNAAPGFTNIPAVINGCSDTVLAVFGKDVGAHARSAVGMAELPFSVPVEIEAEVRIRS